MWRYLNLNPRGIHTGDCVVRACAFATGQSWDQTYEELCDEGFERKEMPSWNSTWWAFLERRGFHRHIIPDRCPYCYTVADFAADHPYGTFVLFIPGNVGHVVALDRGDWFDTWDSGQEIPLAYWQKGDL